MVTNRIEEMDEQAPESALPVWPPTPPAVSGEVHAPETLRTPTVALGALDAKTSRIVAFAVMISQGLEAARWHAVLAQRYGATLAELEHAVAIASFVGGGARSFEVAKKTLAELRAGSVKG